MQMDIAAAPFNSSPREQEAQIAHIAANPLWNQADEGNPMSRVELAPQPQVREHMDGEEQQIPITREAVCSGFN
jgi:hypothetical protein